MAQGTPPFCSFSTDGNPANGRAWRSVRGLERRRDRTKYRLLAVTHTPTWKSSPMSAARAVVTHEDSAGNIGRTVAGDVQVISAGTGISHSERNLAERLPSRLFQIWLLHSAAAVELPRWDNRRFPKADRAGRLITLASGDPQDAEALQIRADARVLGATLFGRDDGHARPRPGFGIPISPPAQGVILVNGQRVVVGSNGIAAIDEPELTIAAEENAEFILVDAA